MRLYIRELTLDVRKRWILSMLSLHLRPFVIECFRFILLVLLYLGSQNRLFLFVCFVCLSLVVDGIIAGFNMELACTCGFRQFDTTKLPTKVDIIKKFIHQK